MRSIWSIGLISWAFSLVYPFMSGNWLWTVLAFCISKIVTIPAHHIAMHRYFAHRSFITTKRKHVFLTWISILLGAGSPVIYSTTHRHHHKHSDNQYDIHSPNNSIWQSLGAWQIKPFAWFNKVKLVRVVPKDLIRDPVIKYVHHNYFKIWGLIICTGILLSFIDWHIPIFIFFAPLGWYIFSSGFFVNTLNHLTTKISYRNFDTDDNSQNNKLVHWYTLGEGLHNNHHAFPNAYNQARKSNEFDFVAWIIEKLFIVDKSDNRAWIF